MSDNKDVDTTTTFSNFTLFNLINILSSTCNDIKTNICSSLGKSYESVTVQDISSCKKSSLTKHKICEDLSALINIAVSVCGEVAVSPVINHINSETILDNSLLDAVDKSFKKHTEFIEQQLSDLKLIVDRQNMCVPPEHIMHQNSSSNVSPNMSNVISPPEPCVYKTFNNFINEDEGSQLSQFLSKIKYNTENGHSVKNFGVEYDYNGAGDGRSGNCEIPAEIQTIIDKINKEYPESKINQCLVNSYIGGTSHLPAHSDDELSINPESLIFSLSIGQERCVVFGDKFSGTETTHVAMDRSMYVMTRSSQAYYTHKIDPIDSSDTSIRYSLVFRHVDRSFKKSTLIIGDSNTRGLKFGEGKGNFGRSLPGKRVQATKVENINPFDCAAYANVVLVVGTNNLRRGHVSNTGDIDKIVQSLAEKIAEIEKIRKDIKIKLMPVLPTRYAEMNRHIMYFNRKIYARFIMSGENFNISIPGVHEFVDNDNLIRDKLTRPGDAIHLNDRGLSIFASCIKSSILPFPGRAVGGDRKRSQGPSQGRGSRAPQ